ncbi:MAG: enolase C-terminal domain-like protein, partial [Bacteroidota bacterium]
MKVIEIQSIPIRIPLKLTFAQSNNQASRSNSVILKVLTDQGTIGYGECCPREYVTGENVSSVNLDVQSLQREVRELEFHSIEDIKHWILEIAPSKIGLATLCAIEMALLDVWSKEKNVTLIESMRGGRKEIFSYAGVVPLGPINHLKPVLERFHFGRVKLKIDHDFQMTLEKIQLIRELYGPETDIQVDVNAGWTLQDACVQVPELIQAGVSCIEQPFPTDKDEQMGWLTWKYGKEIDVMADESACSFRQIQHLVENGFCNKLNLKLSKNGG